MILDGFNTAKRLNEELKQRVKELSPKPRLEIILIGNDPSSLSYVNAKIKTQSTIGMLVNFNHYKDDVQEEVIYDLIKKMNNDNAVTGILLQLPIPIHLNSIRLIEAIDYRKDVDGFHTMNQGLLFQKRDGIRPATPKGIMMLLDEYNVEIEGKHVVVIGRSQIVGAPLAKMFLDRNATVTICHSKTRNLSEITNQADILVSAIGRPKFVTEDMVKEGVVVIDVGINRVFGKIEGDVDFERVSKKASMITPVPRGVGPMTICALSYNLYELYLKQKGEKNV